jgi:trigger factor
MSFTYRGLQTELERHIITEEEVQQHIQRLIAENPRVEVVTDRAAQLGDEVILDYAGFCDGVQFQGGTAEKQSLTLGSGMFIPGFEEQLVGAKIGEDVSVMVTFPTEYHAPHLAGKAAEFKCKIHEIRVSTLYQADDAFARDFAKCENFADFHDKLAASMQEYVNYRGEMDLQDRLLKMAVETFEYEPSAEKVEREMDDQLDTLKAQLAQEGLNMEMYCSFMGTTEAQIREDSRNGAIASLRTQAAIEEIVFLEDLKAEEDEINQAVALVARQNNMTLEQLKPYYDEAFEASIVRHVLTSKVMKLMRDAAVITEK